MRRSRRVQGLPPEFTPIVDSHVEGNPIVQVEEEFTSYDNPLTIQQPTADDTTFHFVNLAHLIGYSITHHMIL